MILQKLRIKHYKRFRDQTIEFPSAGIFGVVGPNGAGKSTFFEAILWTLFGPGDAKIAARDVTPRGLKERGAKTEVALTVETADAVYTIVRRLSANGTNAEAEIFRNDEQQPFVQGVREVTRYVRGTLLRMTPAAFATTFFTRQKDLSFFTDLSNPARVQEMQRLLDLDALDLAQDKFKLERRETDMTYRARAALLAQQEGTHNFAAEIAEAQEVEEGARAILADLTEQRAALKREQTAADAVLRQLTDLHTQHTELNTARARVEQERAAAVATAEAAIQQLDALDELAIRVAALAPDAAQLPIAEEALRTVQAAQEHAQQIAAAAAEVRQAESTVLTLSRNVDELVTSLDPLRDMLWTWDDVVEAPAGLPRARALADALAPTATMLAERVAERDTLQAFQKRASDAQTAVELVRMRGNAVAKIDAYLNVVLAGGDPEASVDALTRQDRELTDALTRQDMELKSLLADHKRYKDLLHRWEGANPDEPCPTCGRPFAPEDAEIAFTSLRESITRCEHAGKGIRSALEATRVTGREIQRHLQADTERLTQKHTNIAQREQALRQQAEAQTLADESARTLHEVLAAAGRRTPPSDDELRHVLDELALLQQAALAAKNVASLVRQLVKADTICTERHAALVALGPNTYDAVAHRAARDMHTRLVGVAAQERQMRDQLATRPRIQTTYDDASRRIATSDTRLADLTARQATLGFDPGALAIAQGNVAALTLQVNDLNTAYTDARIAMTQAENETRQLIAANIRLAALRDEVTALKVEADRLDLMTKGFAEFSGELTARIRPRLSDNATDLMERMTTGRYTRMEFNDSYVPLLYNDAQPKFSIDKFSGGEQDVATLAARIGLAQLLAERGGYRIGFMVLDEVFGSLDSERRGTVLDALAALREVVPQLFIISHVDDVRLSPVMDEVWTVAAAPDGTSEVHRRDVALLLGPAA